MPLDLKFMQTDQSKTEFTGQKTVTKTRRRQECIVKRQAVNIKSRIADALSEDKTINIILN